MELTNAMRSITLRSDLPGFHVGDTVRVHVRVIEGEKERLQTFQGVVIRKKGTRASASFTVRKISSGIGVERIFPVNSPSISSLEVVRHGHVRRAKLYYLRGKKGKAVRVREKRLSVIIPQAGE